MEMEMIKVFFSESNANSYHSYQVRWLTKYTNVTSNNNNLRAYIKSYLPTFTGTSLNKDSWTQSLGGLIFFRTDLHLAS